MAKNLNDVLGAVASAAKTAGEEESVRNIANSPLVSSIPVGVGSSLVNQSAQNQTTRLFAGSDSAITGSNQGDRDQVPPSTDNKVPRIYGQAVTGGVITDTYKSSANTIFVCFTLSEMNYDGFDYFWNNTITRYPAWTLQNVYRDNYECKFANGSASSLPSGQNPKVYYLEDIDDGSCVNIIAANVLNVWAWAGNSTADAQIFPRRGNSVQNVNAFDVFPTWDANITMDNTVFAIVEVDRLNEDFDPTANVEIDEVGEWRFNIQTEGYYEYFPSDPFNPANRPLWNPAVALQDYLTNSVYGCGLSNADIDLNSIAEWEDYCDDTMEYVSFVNTTVPDGPPSRTGTLDGQGAYIYDTEKRRCDGFINTQIPVIDNINQICQAGDATFSYDSKQGKFKVLINKQITTAEATGAFKFDRNNILGAVTVNSTDLYSLFNFAEVRFPNYLQQDQSDSLIVEIPVSDRVTNEPVSGTNYTIPMVHRRFQAAEMANTSLKQSRVNTTYSFTGDHTTIEVDIGDYVKITDETKYLDEKIARVMRVTEREDAEGTLVLDFTCLEYSDAPFEENFYLNVEDEPFGRSAGLVESEDVFDGATFSNQDFFATYEIPFGTTPSGTVVETGNIYLITETDTGVGNIYNYQGNLLQANYSASSIEFATNPPATVVNANDQPWLAIKGTANIAEWGSIATGTWDYQYITLTNQDPDSTQLPETVTCKFTIPGSDNTNYGWFPLRKLTPGTYTISMQYELADKQSSGQNPDNPWQPTRRSLVSTTGNIVITDLDCDTPSSVTLEDTTYGKGTRLWDDFGTINRSGDQLTWAKIYPRQYDVCNIVQAEFEVSTNLLVDWSSETTSRIGLIPTANITFENKNTVDTQTFTMPLPGIDLIDETANGNVAAIKGVWVNNTSTVYTTPSHYGLDDDWYPARLQTDLLTQHDNFTGLTFDGSINFTHIPHNYRYKL